MKRVESVKMSWKESVYIKLLSIFVLIMTPLFFLYASTYTWSSRLIYEEISGSVNSQLSYYMTQLDRTFEQVRGLGTDLVSDDDLARLAFFQDIDNNFDRTQTILRLCKRLTAVKSSSSYIEDVCVWIPELNWVLHADGHPYGNYTDINQEDLQNLSQLASTAFPFVSMYANELVMSISPGQKRSDGLPYFLVEISFSTEEIFQSFLHSSSHRDQPTFMEFETNGQLFYNDAALAEGLLEKNWEENLSAFQDTSSQWNPYLICAETSAVSQLRIMQVLPSSQVFGSLYTMRGLNLCFQFFLVATVCIFLYAAYHLVKKPLIHLTNAYQEIEKGNFNVKIKEPMKNEFGCLYRGFNQMSRSLKDLIDKVYNQQILIQRAELKQLQSQINPHFLYNSYFLLHRLIKRQDFDNALDISRNMGTYFQFITRNASDTVELLREYEHAEIYANIQAIRFEGRIAVEIEPLPPSLQQIQVPRLILQPIIENAFEHSLESKQEDGLLKVQVEQWDFGFIISVEDNGENLSDNLIRELQLQVENGDVRKETTALINIHLRLQLMFGQDSGLVLRRSQLGGLRVEIRIIVEKGGIADVPPIDCR